MFIDLPDRQYQGEKFDVPFLDVYLHGFQNYLGEHPMEDCYCGVMMGVANLGEGRRLSIGLVVPPVKRLRSSSFGSSILCVCTMGWAWETAGSSLRSPGTRWF
jgi:hypothetical protein